MRRWVLALAILLSVLPWRAPAAQPAQPRNLVLITIDGLRWQEFFGGADRDYFKKQKDGTPGPAERRFWRPTVDERRAVLMPFVWSTIASKGQILGDASKGSSVRLTNGLWFSYPGYNEMLSGAADPRVDSNDKVPNPNVTVLEWLNGRPGFKGQVAESVNAEIAADRAIQVRTLPRAEAFQIPDIIRTATNLLPESVEQVRLVDITGLDVQADGGTHVASTAMIGRMEVVKMENKGRGFRRLRIRIV